MEHGSPIYWRHFTPCWWPVHCEVCAGIGFAGIALYLYGFVAAAGAGSVAAWALLLAYVATGASVVGGFIHYANVVLREWAGVSTLAMLAVLISIWIAYRDVKVSAQLMVYVELASVALIGVVFVMFRWKRGLHIDPAQFTLKGVHFSGVRLGLVLAMFSFVGFESATTQGEEARHPLKTIPRAVI